MAHRARYSGRPALRPSGHQHKTLMFKIAPCNFASHSASSPDTTVTRFRESGTSICVSFFSIYNNEINNQAFARSGEY
jgi:hypothetical protein